MQVEVIEFLQKVAILRLYIIIAEKITEGKMVFVAL